ncbi:hypothetical protein FA95DRAFT_1559468 [Auriscalpium vulgare]|uniref:Uncharacterized protein n=1 Tax=Auriscalpium vulgare TaxID=40419 RepID=A0ACB8RSG8_9AGAM|nr:hypothetical protein FA95DRAFT_1559468 [Auriscalpium vulgare]
MADLATNSVLQHLKSLFPSAQKIGSSADVLKNPWWIVATVAYSGANRPEAVPVVFKHVLADLEQVQAAANVPTEKAQEERLLLARRFREALFKSGMVSGYSKAINGLVSLSEATPEDLRDTKTMRNTKLSPDELEKKGEEFFKVLYGDTADNVQGLLDKIYPDMGWFSNTLAYGAVYGHLDILDQLETSWVLVGTLIAGDTARQVGWHLANARRGGATLEEAKAARQIAIDVSASAGVKWRDGVPDITE